MASPQLENGFVAIAYDLFLAITTSKLSLLEKDVLNIVIYLTYGSGKTKAAIDATDIQILLTYERRIRLERVEAALGSLLRKHVLYTSGTNNSMLGVQKDFEKWGSRSSDSESDGHGVQVITNVIKLSNNINSLSINRDKLSTLLEYTYRGTEFKYGVTAWGVERKFARLLYRESLTLTGDPTEAAYALKDYIDELRAQDWFNQVKMRFRYMHSRFRQWYKSMPTKPKSIREDEQTTGYRYKYDTLTKDWRITDVKI